MRFVSIDFETATFSRSSACAVGIVTVENGRVVDRYYSLIKPPENFYYQQCIEVHGIQPKDTEGAPTFGEVYPEILQRLEGQVVVAHNESFDRSVLKECMAAQGVKSPKVNTSEPWECTLKIYREKGFNPCRLSDCCEALGIELEHHQALSDALACAELYLRR